MSRYCCKGLGCFSEACFCQAKETFEACPSLSRGKPDELQMSVMVQNTRTEIYMRTQPHAGSSGLRLDYSVPVHCDTFCVKLSNFRRKSDTQCTPYMSHDLKFMFASIFMYLIIF